MTTRYYIGVSDDSMIEVTKEQFVKAERASGFHNTNGEPDELATAGFNASNGLRGSVRYEEEKDDG